jgi:large subunit ribosomal protein L26e
MKLNKDVSGKARKARKAHFGATSVDRARRMVAMLSKDLFQQYNVRSMPIRKDDKVKIVRGKFGSKNHEGKVTACYRKKYVIHVERANVEKSNASSVPVGIQPSDCIITELKMDKSRKAMLKRKNRALDGKFSDVDGQSNMATVD